VIAVPLAGNFSRGPYTFRVFDILKPPPVRQLERLPEGIGIVVDDLGRTVRPRRMHLLLHFRLLM